MSKWYEEAIFYHIYPLGLLGAPKTHQDEREVHRLRELDPWIDHMKDTGFTAVYIGPLFESTSHGYDTKDYRKVDGWWWTACSTIQAASFSLFRICRRTGNILRMPPGIRM